VSGGKPHDQRGLGGYGYDRPVIPAVDEPAAVTASGVHAHPGRGDLAVRVAGGVVAFLGGAGSALVEGLLTPLRLGSWPLPVAPLLGAVLGVPLVAYGAWSTASRLGGIAPLVGWFVLMAVMVSPTAEGDLILPQTLMGLAAFVFGAGSLVVGLYRLSAATRGRHAEIPPTSL
jgi:hypothetical protein